MTPELAALSMVLAVESTREEVIEILADLSDVETVDRYVIEVDVQGDPTTLMLNLDVTSRWAAEDNQHEGAWAITKIISILWEEGNLLNEEVLKPGFRLINSGRVYECSGEFMFDIADTRAGMAAWEEECA